MAVIMVTLGVTWKAATELLESGNCHFIRRKSLIPSQVSSRLQMQILSRSYSSNLTAHCCRKTKLLWEFAESAICWTRLYFIPRSFIILQASASLIRMVASLPFAIYFVSAFCFTILQESMNTFFTLISSTTSWMSSLFLSFSCSFENSSLMNLGFFFALATSLDIVYLVVRNSAEMRRYSFCSTTAFYTIASFSFCFNIPLRLPFLLKGIGTSLLL